MSQRREGKRLLFEIGLLCNLVGTIFLFIAFVSGHWIISWPRVHSGFKRLGLWEACFAGMTRFLDPDQKSYHGCWWILAPEYWKIRSWLMPGWFIFTQVTVTLCLVAEVVGLIIMIIIWLTTGGTQKKMKPEEKKPPPLKMLTTATIITTVTGALMTCTVVIFALGFKLDKFWLPNPYLNYPSWSFGLAIMSAFFSVFGSIAQITLTMIVRQDMRRPPPTINMSGYSLPAEMSHKKSRQDLGSP